MAYVKAIRSAQQFIYIENQYFLGSSYNWPDYKTAGNQSSSISSAIKCDFQFATTCPCKRGGISPGQLIQVPWLLRVALCRCQSSYSNGTDFEGLQQDQRGQAVCSVHCDSHVAWRCPRQWPSSRDPVLSGSLFLQIPFASIYCFRFRMKFVTAFSGTFQLWDSGVCELTCMLFDSCFRFPTTWKSILLIREHGGWDQTQTMKMMYSLVADTLRDCGLSHRHPTDYLNFYCLGNRETKPHGEPEPRNPPVYTSKQVSFQTFQISKPSKWGLIWFSNLPNFKTSGGDLRSSPFHKLLGVKALGNNQVDCCLNSRGNPKETDGWWYTCTPKEWLWTMSMLSPVQPT